MRVTTILATSVASLACISAGCGQKAPGTAGRASGPVSASQPKKGNATAEEVAEEMRGNVSCPAHIKTPPRDPKAPVDDVLGVRPGMTYDEAANVVLCSADLMVVQPDSRGFQIKTYGQTLRQGFDGRYAQAKVAKTSKQIMQEMQDDFIARSGNRVAEPDVKPGQSKWYVGTIGVPGQERVINAAREEWFQESRTPTAVSVEQALLKKYGTATRHQVTGGSDQRYLTWAYDPLGRPITETSPLFNRCTGVASPDGGANFSPDCGIVISAIVFPVPDNHELARYFQVGVVDQAGGYEALTKTEQALGSADAQRKAQAVTEASKNSDAPRL